MRVVALACLLAACLAPASADARGLETLVQDDRVLLHRPVEEVRTAMERLRALGVDRVRLTADWSALAPDAGAAAPPAGFDARDPAAYEQARWRGLDTAVRLAHEHGLRVLVDIGFWAPVWATRGDPGPRARTSVQAGPYADFAVAVVRRYSGRFTPPPPPADAPPPPPPPQSDEDGLLGLAPPALAPRAAAPRAEAGPLAPLPAVDRFALWNEPNHPALLLPQWRHEGGRPQVASAGVYRAMVAAAYPAAKAERPDATILVGNTSSLGSAREGDGAVAPLRFLRELACVDARLRPLATPDCAGFAAVPGDGWAHHPYARNYRPDTASGPRRRDDVLVADLGRLAALLDRLAAGGRLSPALRAIHVTEFGYETQQLGDRPPLPLETHARWLTWAEREAARVPAVRTWAQFLLRDQPAAVERVSTSLRRPFGQYWSGLLTAEGVDKPAARSFVAGLHAERRPRGRLALWGRLRLGAGRHAVTIERSRRGGPWRPLLAFAADGRADFGRPARDVGGALYRLVVVAPGGARTEGLPVAPVRLRTR